MYAVICMHNRGRSLDLPDYKRQRRLIIYQECKEDGKIKKVVEFWEFELITHSLIECLVVDKICAPPQVVVLNDAINPSYERLRPCHPMTNDYEGFMLRLSDQLHFCFTSSAARPYTYYLKYICIKQQYFQPKQIYLLLDALVSATFNHFILDAARAPALFEPVERVTRKTK